MCVKRAPLETFLVQDTEFHQPADCPLVQCPAITTGKTELERFKRTETELREALAREELLLNQKDELIREKELLSRESNHRFLNGLQLVASPLSTQSALSKDAEAAAQLRIAANRVIRIGGVHRRLHGLDTLDSVELKQYLEALCQDMAGMLPIECPDNALSVEGIALTVPTATGIPIGFIVSELVTNAAKYAKGKITISLGLTNDNTYKLSVSDDGPGLPEEFDPAKSKGLGMKIVSSLVKQVHGQLLFGRNDTGQGARFTVLFA